MNPNFLKHNATATNSNTSNNSSTLNYKDPRPGSESNSSLNTISSSFNNQFLTTPPPYLAYPNSDINLLIPTTQKQHHQFNEFPTHQNALDQQLPLNFPQSSILPVTNHPFPSLNNTQPNPTTTMDSSFSTVNPNHQDAKVIPGAPNPRTTVPGLYSSSGFDIMSVLAKVSLRKNPQVSLGPVDMSCSFVVSDARLPDQPIVYVSETFEKLTGYSAIDCIGRNCRFLQSPDGLVTEGTHRRYTDNATVFQLKSALIAKQESQFTLINYKLGGEPFINLITIIPITWERDDEVAYFVGFQIDLVEQPNSIMQRMRDGTYVVNYQVAKNPVPVSRGLPMPNSMGDNMQPNFESLDLATVDHSADMIQQDLSLMDIPGGGNVSSSKPIASSSNIQAGGGMVISGGTGSGGTNVHTHSIVSSTSGGGNVGGGLAGGTVQDQHQTNLTGHFAMKVTELVGVGDTVEAANLFYKALVNQVDFIHVLSLRGILLYVSRDSQRLLEYEEHELVGRSLSEFCHPGDLVSVMRELKESSNGIHQVNMVYRIRRKYSGYMWMEVSGKCTQGEKAKGKKFVVLTGREKPVVRVHQTDIARVGGVNQVDMWAKLALEGMFLHVSTDAQVILGFSDTELVGKSLLDLVHIDDLKSLRYALDLVRKANVVTLTHRIKNKKGEYTLVTSGFVPGNSASPECVKFALYRCVHISNRKQGSEVSPLGDLVAYPASEVVDDKDDFFDVLSPVRCTSWQYELHQLRLQNRRLRAEIEDIDNSSSSRGGHNKRKRKLMVASNAVINQASTLSVSSSSSNGNADCPAAGSHSATVTSPHLPVVPSSE